VIEPDGVSVTARSDAGVGWAPSGQPLAAAMLTVGMSVVLGGGVVGLGPMPA
jgi:hypothetical protein